MTFYYAIGIAAILFCLSAMQCLYVWRVYRFLFPVVGDPSEEEQESTVESAFSPEVAVVICLRGSDPSLHDCLTGISLQDYSNFSLHLVVDDIHDPSLEVVEGFFHGNKKPPIHVIENLSESCSLKCSGLLEGLRAIPETVEIVAFLDADTVPDQNWLSDLIEPFSDSRVGATTGNRWFDPVTPSLGGYVRQIWNAAAVVQMDVYNIAWGGTLAIRRSTLAATGLPEKWSRAFCEDTMLNSALKAHQQKLVRVPHLICENTETTTLPDTYRWIVRQLLTSRLYHSRWPRIKLHAWGTVVGSVIAPLSVLLFFALNDGKPFYIILLAFVLYQALNLALLAATEWMHLKVIDQRNSFNQQERTPANVPMRLLGVAVVQLLHPLACSAADGLRQIRWRGIDYDIGRRNEITMREYIPYCEIATEDQTTGLPISDDDSSVPSIM